MDRVEFHRLSSPAERRFLLVLEDREDVLEELARFARREKVTAAEFTGIGCLADVIFQRGSSTRYVVADGERRLAVKTFDGWIRAVGHGETVAAYAVVSAPNGRRFAGRMVGGHVDSVLKLVLTEVEAGQRAVSRDRSR